MGRAVKSAGNKFELINDPEIAPQHIFAEAVELARRKLSVNWKCANRFERTITEVMNEMGEKYPDLLIGQIEDLGKAVYRAKKNHDDYQSELARTLEYVMGEIEKSEPGNKPPSSRNFPIGLIRFPNGEPVGEKMLARALNEVQEKRVEALKRLREEELEFEAFIRTKIESRFPGLSFIPPNFFAKPLYCKSGLIPGKVVAKIFRKIISEREMARKENRCICSDLANATNSSEGEIAA